MINIVIGAGFGDEGKGQTVAKILNGQAGSTNFVVRFNGGHQAGHTVEHNGKRHVFSNFAAGTLHGVKSYWSQHCTIHPKGIRNEHGVLTDLGEDPELWIDPLCPITLPHDISHNLDISSSSRHGTVGVGFGSTIDRNEKHYRLHAHDMLDYNVLVNKLELIQKHYYRSESCREFYDDVMWLMDQKKIRIARPAELINPIFEGAQGIMLDEEFGFFPHVTRSKTTAANALQVMLQLGCFEDVTINYVSRTYQTRHGAGPFANTKAYLDLRDDFKETNQTNKHQGEFRKAILDLGLLEHAIRCSELELGNNFPRTVKIHFTCHDHHKKSTFWVIRNGEMWLTDKKDLQASGDEIVANV